MSTLCLQGQINGTLFVRSQIKPLTSPGVCRVLGTPPLLIRKPPFSIKMDCSCQSWERKHFANYWKTGGILREETYADYLVSTPTSLSTLANSLLVSHSSNIKYTVLELERWLSHQEYLLLLWKTWVGFLAPTWWLTKLSVTPVPGDPIPSSDLCGRQACT